MRKIGIDKFSPRHRQSSAVLLDCHLSKCMSIDGGVPSEQAIGTHDAGFLKMKNSDAPAVKREAKEYWDRKRR